jgi:2-desacetyl-2-hydroxyethyl bacteriochlorophyllide A dehydrogenase
MESKSKMNVSHLPDTMRAALLRGPHTFSLERIPVPPLLQDEVLVAVEAVGICGSDLHFYTGERPQQGTMILGHEITGRLVAVGAHVPPERVGERVTIEPNIPCGACRPCLRGLGRLCERKQIIGQTRQGGLAEYVAIDHRFAWSVPETFTLSDAATVEPTAVAIHALSRAQIEDGATIAIVGCGGVGRLLATVAVAQGYQVVGIEPNTDRRAAILALGALDAREVRDADEACLFFENHKVVAIFECAGLPTTTQLCLDAAPAGCSLVLVGLATENIAFNPLRFVRRELDIRGALIYDHPIDFAATIALITSGKLAPGKTAGQPQPLENVSAIFEAMANGTLSAKPLICPQIQI